MDHYKHNVLSPENQIIFSSPDDEETISGEISMV